MPSGRGLYSQSRQPIDETANFDLIRLSRAAGHVDRLTDIVKNQVNVPPSQQKNFKRTDIERILCNLVCKTLQDRGQELIEQAMAESPMGFLNAIIKILPKEQTVQITSNITQRLIEGRERARNRNAITLDHGSDISTLED